MDNTNTQVTVPQSAEQVVRRVLEPDEETLWTGRPDLKTLMMPAKRFKKRRLVRTLLSVPVYLDEIPEPVTTYEKTTGSKVAKFFGVKYLESDPDVSWGRFKGYSVTHRKLVTEMGVSGAGGDHERPALSKSATLYDGRLQLGIVSTWPEGSDTLRQAVEKIASTMQVE